MRLALIAIWVGLVPIAKQHAVTTAKQVRHVMCHENVARLTIATTIVWPCVQGNMHPKGANVFADRPLLRLQDAGATPQAAMAMGTAPKLKGGGGVGVCELVHCGRTFLWQWVSAGRMPHHLFGR